MVRQTKTKPSKSAQDDSWKRRIRDPVHYAEKLWQTKTVERRVITRSGKVERKSVEAEQWRLKELVPVEKPSRPCGLCRSETFWARDKRGPWICPVCHPPHPYLKAVKLEWYEVPF